jgi:hypothetical protein
MKIELIILPNANEIRAPEYWQAAKDTEEFDIIRSCLRTVFSKVKGCGVVGSNQGTPRCNCEVSPASSADHRVTASPQHNSATLLALDASYEYDASPCQTMEDFLVIIRVGCFPLEPIRVA